MAQLVLLVIAGITGFVGYSEAAKIEKRFRRGPLGVPALVWGIVCFVVAGLLGALLAPEVVFGALIGFVAHGEAKQYERQCGEGPFGVPPLAVGVVCAGVGLIGALATSTFVVWALAGFVGYTEAARYERQYSKAPLGVSALVWGVVCFFFGLIGAFLTSALAWSVVCAFLGLVGALLLLLAERNGLLAERNALVAENNELITEMKTRRQTTASKSSGAPPDPVAAAPSRASDPPPQRSAPPASSGWPSAQPAAQSRGGANGNDLLPRRR